MKSKKLEIEIPEGKTAVWRNGILTLIDEPEKDVKNVLRRLRTPAVKLALMRKHGAGIKYPSVLNLTFWLS
ncbi:hypothetical protein NXX04_17765 [Bacteroides ovatus]|nr:hypothetical protein [Bacteroides ovatus]